jgi:hypothetical protein
MPTWQKVISKVILIIGDPIIFHSSGMKKRKCFKINTSIIVKIKHSGMVLMVLRSSGMLLSHLKKNRDAIPPHLKPC